MTTKAKTDLSRDLNPDLITGAPGSHPVATGVGAAAAGAAGAAIGSIVPGIGTVIGGVIGAIAGSVGGGYAGKAVGEMIDPTGDEKYWREHHETHGSDAGKANFEQVRPAYKYGSALADRAETPHFDEKTARAEWDTNPDGGAMSFDSAKGAIAAEFNRKLQLREEQLRIEKERIATGEVKLRKEVTTETKTVEVPVQREEVVITRRAVAGSVGDGSAIKEEEIRIPVSEEKVNVSKETVVTGEVEVSKHTTVGKETVSDQVRKENVKVDQTGGVVLKDKTE